MKCTAHVSVAIAQVTPISRHQDPQKSPHLQAERPGQPQAPSQTAGKTGREERVPTLLCLGLGGAKDERVGYGA